MLRRRTPDDKLVVKMWLYPFLTLVTIVGILAVLVQLGWTEDTRSQLFLGLGSWAVVLVLYFVTKAMGGSVSPEELESRREEAAAASADCRSGAIARK